jgi:formate hydrogenlyase subunit 6/NADH:ubiquinone oxidoreductase subunit I
MLGWLVARGVDISLHGASHCPDCEHGARGEPRLALHLDGVDLLRVALGNEQWGAIELAGEDPAAQSVAEHRGDRRQWLRRLVGRGVDAAVQPLKPPAPPIPLRAIRAAAPLRTIGRDLLQSIAWPPVASTTSTNATSAPPAPPPARHFDLPAHGALQLANLAVNPGCVACEACARACPTGALVVRESASVWQLVFNASRCVGCRVCAEARQPRVLILAVRHDENVFNDEQKALFGLPKRRCQACDRPYVDLTGRDTCPICHSDDADFAAIFG